MFRPRVRSQQLDPLLQADLLERVLQHPSLRYVHPLLPLPPSPLQRRLVGLFCRVEGRTCVLYSSPVGVAFLLQAGPGGFTVHQPLGYFLGRLVAQSGPLVSQGCGVLGGNQGEVCGELVVGGLGGEEGGGGGGEGGLGVGGALLGGGEAGLWVEGWGR